jgi:uncharacterized protein YjbI with pentapeptide repeats
MFASLRQMFAALHALKAEAGWKSVQLAAVGGGVLGFIGDFIQPEFQRTSPLWGPLGWLVLAAVVVTASAWWLHRRLQRRPAGFAAARHCARALLAGWTMTAVLLIVLAVNLVVQEPRGVAATVIEPVAKLQAELFGDALKSIGEDVAAIERSLQHQEKTLSHVAESMDLSVALSLLDRASAARDGSRQGQVKAIESLLARGYEYAGADFSGVAFQGANLSGGVFRKAKLHAVELGKVDARGANFSGSGLRFGNLEAADFSGADLSASYSPFVYARGAVFRGANLSPTNLFGSDLRDTNLRDAKLRGAALAFADLRGARLDGADLTGAYLIGALLEGASLDDVTFDMTDVSGAVLDIARLSASQKRGLCQRSNNDVVGWRIDLIEKWPSNKYSTGFQFEQLYTRGAAFRGFARKELASCDGPPDRAIGFDAAYPAQQSMHLDRAYLAKAGRQRRLVERVNAHAALIAEARNAGDPN